MIKPSLTTTILAIESSCDDTGCAILQNGKILANSVANQSVHEQYGGVVPELASRAHQQNIVPVIDSALKQASIALNTIDAIAYTKGPGLMGSLLVGGNFAKGLSLALNKPLIEVNHMQAHILAHFIENEEYSTKPTFPFICLTVSGGHTQLVLVKNYFDMKILGETLDDAAGEAFDKVAKILNLPYPGGPLVDKYAQQGNPLRFKFPKTNMPDYNFSFSGFKTSVLNFIKKEVQNNSDFVQQNITDICASAQKNIVSTLIDKLMECAKANNIKQLALAGGVSANSLLRKEFKALEQKGYQTFIPPFEYCTDNAAMIAIVGYLKFQVNDFADQSSHNSARLEL